MNGRDGKGWNDCYKGQEITLACVQYLVSVIVHLNLSIMYPFVYLMWSCGYNFTSHSEMRCDQCKLFLCVICFENAIREP